MLFLITLLGLLLRLTFISKPEGLWNDEYVSWYIANTPFVEGFWTEILKQCHMPFYYLYLKIFSEYNDFVLRLSSVVPNIIAIPIMYLVGKEFSRKAGYFCALITSILSFLVYYSQEVRFYSILFLFSALSLLFTIKYIKNNTKLNLFGYIVSNLLILLTHVLGIIYVFFNILYIVLKTKKIAKPIFLSFLLVLPIVIILGLNIIQMLPSSQWWGHFSYTNILFLFSDFFSPILTNNVNAPPKFFYNNSLTYWILPSMLIATFAIICSLKKTFKLNLISLGVIIIMSILAFYGKLVFITKYAIEILPILILSTVLGLENLKKIGTVLLTIFVSCHLGAIFTPYYVTKIPRTEGHRIVGEILKKHDANIILFTYYEPNRFKRYIDLSQKKALHISKSNRFMYKDNPEKILNNVTKGETVSIVFLDSVSFFDENFLNSNKDNLNIPEMFITFSLIKNRLYKAIDEDYTNYKIDKIGAWTVITGKKT